MTPRRTTTALLIALLALLAPPAPAAERELLRLESSPPAATLHVLEVAGVQLAKSAQSFPTWTLKPGDTVTADARPPDRVIELYTGSLQAPSLLCRVVLRYYPQGARWTPHFRLDEEPLVARVNGRWQPLELIRGAAGLLVRHGGTLPNADGFFPTIEFGLSAGGLSIVAWQVR